MPLPPDMPEIIITSDDFEPPRIPLARIAIGFGLLFGLFLIYHDFAPLYTDWLWFHEIGYVSVFTTTIVAKTELFFAGALLFFICFYGNGIVARRLAPERSHRFLRERFGSETGMLIERYIGRGLFCLAAFLALWAGRLAVEEWSHWLEIRNAASFGVIDPVFHKDVSFYVFAAPFLRFLCDFALGTLVLTLLVVVMLHIASTAIQSWDSLDRLRPEVRAQLAAIATAIALVMAAGTWLDRFDLLTSDNGVFTGPGYADIHYRLLALNIQVVLLFVVAVACLVSTRAARGPRLAVRAAIAWAAVSILLGNILPGIGQKLYVDPNQFTMEQEFIQRNIAFTRKAFGLETVKRVDSFPADNSLSSAGIAANRATLDNVRLWDYSYLAKVYSQIQTIKPYYKFEKIAVGDAAVPNIDIDRYRIGGKMRQVMLAAREMDSNALPSSALTWQNQRLGYTHGHGLAMSPVNRVVDGNPDYFLSGLPVASSPEASDLKVTEPAIYYGQLNHEYVFVDTAQQEFDYPSTQSSGAGGAQDHYVTYHGRGGIRIGDSALAKLAFSLRLGDANVLLAKGFKDSTRVLFRRDIRERIQNAAPFVQQDNDPYLVVDPDDGRLVWMVDCYTLSSRFPYSTSREMPLNSSAYIAPNYIRNSVKATVDAYDGTVNLYLADPKDPIARTYGRIFPGVLKPLSAMPAGLRAHLRYPEDLFRLQRSIYASYHVDDARVFYLKEDAWAIPVEPNSDSTAPAAPPQVGPNGEPVASTTAAVRGEPMEPYYVIMKLPGMGETPVGQDEEFLLMSPLAPINREAQNILGWMCARCDPDHYGELVLYRFPQSASVEGPSQVLQRINSDRLISPQLTFLRQGGSSATFGNLLVIPLERSLLYIAPLYVEASTSGTKLPQLQKVAVVYGQRAAMGDNLDKALTDLFPGGGGAPEPVSPVPGGAPAPARGTTGPLPPGVRALIERASAQYDTAQTRLGARDLVGWATAMKALDQTMRELRRAVGR